MKTISPQQLNKKIAAGEKLFLLDVRTPCEYSEAHAPGVTLEPLGSLNPSQLIRRCAIPSDTPIYVFCQSGVRAEKAVQKFEQAGLNNCVLVEGGTLAWIQAGLPVERGTASGISLERQVRIAAGAFVLIGTLLGIFLHSYFLAIPVFVGGGLVFAGITNRCGLALVLAHMPWNKTRRAKSETSAACAA